LVISNIVFPVGTNMSERFMFMPSVGFCLVLAVLLWHFAKPKQNLSNLTLAMAGAAIFIVMLSAKTVVRNQVWKDNYTLFTTDIKTSENSIKLLNAVGAETSIQSAKITDEKLRNEKLKESLVYLEKAIALHPTYKNAYLQLGNAYNYLKEYDKSIQYYQQVLKFDADDANGFNNLGITYREAGKYYGENGNMEKAMQYLKKAEEMRPDDYEVIRLLGVANGVSGNHLKAVDYFTKATQLEPQNADAFWNLGNAWYYAGDQAKADQYRSKALEMDPEVGKRK
jgi:protein O-mannosyl-transferase